MASSDSVAGKVRSAVLRSRERFWRPTDFDGSPGAVAVTLSRLHEEGELRHIRRGLYWRGRKTLLGMAPPRPELVARELVGTVGVGPSGLSAASALGLSTQVPSRTIVAVPTRPPVDPSGVRFVDRSGREGRAKAGLRPFEIALLEVLEDPSRFIEVDRDEADARVRALFETGVVNAARLSRAAADEPARVRENLRDLFARIDRRDFAAVVPGRRTREMALA
jgi:hypothetical protein